MYIFGLEIGLLLGLAFRDRVRVRVRFRVRVRVVDRVRVRVRVRVYLRSSLTNSPRPARVWTTPNLDAYNDGAPKQLYFEMCLTLTTRI